MAEGEREMLALAGLAPEAVLGRLSVGERGLDAAEAEERRERCGANVVGRAKKKGFVLEILERFKNPLVVQLLVIGSVSFAMGDGVSAAIVGAMIALSVLLSYIQEKKSGKAVEKLMAMVKTTCTVLRGARQQDLPMSELVPGDIVILAAGSIIPADLRLIASKDFFVSQSALTGESLPIEKGASSCETAANGAL